MKKNGLVFLLVFLLFISLSGCNSQPPEDQNRGSSQNTPIDNINDTGKVSDPDIAVDTPAQFDGYRMVSVDGGDMSGHREANVVVDIGFGDREYWAYTNEYGQLVRVVAKEIILQDDNREPVTPDGRYYDDEANVPGTELPDYDQGHVIADSLGGVSNAYNITPQNSVLNRHGDQAYMEKVIRDAGGCTNFEAIITYPDTKTQIPSHYHYTYTINGNVIVEDFDNDNPDKINKPLIEQSTDRAPAPSPSSGDHGLAAVDANGDGRVTIKEAKAAGFKMPITRDHWLNLDIN